MTSPARDFGVQSFCFRNFKDHADVANKVKQIGVSKIELCAVHVDFNAPETWDAVIKPYQDAGVSIPSVGVQTFTGDEARERQWFEFAQKAGAKVITAHFKIDSYREAVPVAEKLCKEFGIRLAIHCHGGYMFGGSLDVLKHLLAISGDEIGICIDTAWCMQAGGNPVEWAKQFAGRLYGVHYKDFIFEKTGKWQDVIVGEGNLDLPAFLEAVEAGGFDGSAVIEYEADVEAPVPALTRCVEAMRGVAAATA